MRRVKQHVKKPNALRKCRTPECETHVSGQTQLCDTCQAKKLVCRNCGEPHGGPPATTRLCTLCRRGKKGRPRGPRNPAWTEADDAALRAAYAVCNAHEIGPRLRELFPVRPGWSIKRRAQVIGAATVRKKEPPWSDAERAVLTEFAHLTPERVAMKFRGRGFTRTLTAIAIQMKRMDVRRNIDGQTAQSLARLLDVDVHKVTGWIENKLLVGERRGTTGDHHDRWYITMDAIRTFLLANPEQYELSKIERAGSKMWFLELVTHGRISETGAPVTESAAPAGAALPTEARTFPLYGERVTLAALSDICGRSGTDLLNRIDGLGMAVEAAAFGGDGEEELVTTTLGLEVAKQLRALAKARRAGPVALAKLTGLPTALLERVAAGTLPIVPAAVMTMAEKLGGEVRVLVTPKA